VPKTFDGRRIARAIATLALVAGVTVAATSRTQRILVPGYHYPVDARIVDWNDPRLKKRDGENPLEFAARATAAVYRAFYHCDMRLRWPPGAEQLETQKPGLFREVGVLSLEHFICGYCHQRAFILASAIKRAGIQARVWGINGHVVTIFSIEGKDYAADADFGIDPFRVNLTSPDELRSSVANAYEVLIHRHGIKMIETIVEYYTTIEDNVEYYNMEHLHKLALEQRKLLSLLDH
jgi:hypothetical protein